MKIEGSAQPQSDERLKFYSASICDAKIFVGPIFIFAILMHALPLHSIKISDMILKKKTQTEADFISFSNNKFW